MTKRISPILPVLLLVLSLAPAAQAKFSIRARNVGGTSYVRLDDVAGYYGMKLTLQGKSLSLSDAKRRLEFTLERRKCELLGVGATLFHAPFVHRQTPLLSARDFVLIVDPVLRPHGLPRYSLKRIAIDPGHGGKDSGAKGRAGTLEKDLNLTMAKHLQAILIAKGYEVRLTRNTDVFVDLAKRPAAAANWPADLFISIHANAAGSKAANGIETYAVTPLGVPGSTNYQAETNAVPGNAYDLLNLRLAYDLQRQLIGATGATDRGVRHARFLVLKQARCPAVLVELGFLSNAAEEQKLRDPRYQQKLATALANGIIYFHHDVAPK